VKKELGRPSIDFLLFYDCFGWSVVLLLLCVAICCYLLLFVVICCYLVFTAARSNSRNLLPEFAGKLKILESRHDGMQKKKERERERAGERERERDRDRDQKEKKKKKKKRRERREKRGEERYLQEKTALSSYKQKLCVG